MSDKQIQDKLQQLVDLSNELYHEARRRYGDEAQIFYEPESGFFVMDGDDCANAKARQSHVRFHSTGICHLQAGGW